MFSWIPFSRRLHTVLVVTPDTIARIDLRSGRSLQVLQSWHEPRPAGLTWSLAARQALCLGPERRTPLYVLVSELWSGVVSLERRVVDAIDEDQLEQTLRLELEYESGISAFESRLGKVLIGEDETGHTWRVVQADTSQLDNLATAAPDRRRRVLAVAKLPVNDPSIANEVGDSSDAWSHEQCVEEAKEWLQAHLAGERREPAITLEHGGWTVQQRRTASVSLAVATVVLCLAHYVHTSRGLSRVERELATLVRQRDQLSRELRQQEAITSRVAEAKLRRSANIEEKTKQIAALRRMQFQRRGRQSRPISLLQALSRTTNEAHCIVSIRILDSHAQVSGWALDATSLQAFAKQLERELAGAGWLVRPATMSLDETRLIRFEIKLTPQPLIGEPPGQVVASTGVADVR